MYTFAFLVYIHPLVPVVLFASYHVELESECNVERIKELYLHQTIVLASLLSPEIQDVEKMERKYSAWQSLPHRKVANSYVDLHQRGLVQGRFFFMASTIPTLICVDLCKRG